MFNPIPHGGQESLPPPLPKRGNSKKLVLAEGPWCLFGEQYLIVNIFSSWAHSDGYLANCGQVLGYNLE